MPSIRCMIAHGLLFSHRQLEQGRIAMTGTGAELLDNPHVEAACLDIGDAPVEQSQAPSLNRGSLS
jgi:hypothetical protein